MINDIKEHMRRREMIDKTRLLMTQTLPVDDSDETSLMLGYNGFYMQVSFYKVQPLIVVHLARALSRRVNSKDVQFINEMNLKCVLGCHAINTEISCYSYRTTHWLDVELTRERILEMLECDVDEAERVCFQLAHRLEVKR